MLQALQWSGHGRIGATAARIPRGFSLIELMVVLAIAGILLFVALPGYQFAVVKSTRAAGRATLLDLIARQEQYFVNHKRYALDLGSLGLPEAYYIDSQGEATDPGAAAYRVTLNLPDGSYSGATAMPVNRQAGDSACMALSLSRLGIRAASGALSANPGDCW